MTRREQHLRDNAIQGIHQIVRDLVKDGKATSAVSRETPEGVDVTLVMPLPLQHINVVLKPFTSDTND